MRRRTWTETTTFPLHSNKHPSTKYLSYTSKSRLKRRSRRRSGTRSWPLTVSRASTRERPFCEVFLRIHKRHTRKICQAQPLQHRRSHQCSFQLATVYSEARSVTQRNTTLKPSWERAKNRLGDDLWIPVIRCVGRFSFWGACSKMPKA